MSALLPSETKCEKPIPDACAQSSRAVHMAPDWLSTATGALAGMPSANEAFIEVTVSMIPSVLGPTSRMP